MPTASPASTLTYPSRSDQARLRRWGPRAERQLGLMRPAVRAFEVREDLRDSLGLFDARDDLELAAAAHAAVDLDAKQFPGAGGHRVGVVHVVTLAAIPWLA